MATVVNGITIPENIDSVFANEINIDTIVANGVIVWQKKKENYVIKNGVLLNAPNAGWHADGHSTSGGEKRVFWGSSESDYRYCYGCGGHTASNANDYWSVWTGAMPTNGYQYITITFVNASWSDQGYSEGKIIGINNSGSEIKIFQDYVELSGKMQSDYTKRTFTITLDISNYHTISVLTRKGCSENSNFWVSIGFENVYFHN